MLLCFLLVFTLCKSKISQRIRQIYKGIVFIETTHGSVSPKGGMVVAIETIVGLIIEISANADHIIEL